MAWKRPKEFDEKQIQKLLRMTDEQDWLEFKREMKLFTADGKVAEKPRDEFIKISWDWPTETATRSARPNI